VVLIAKLQGASDAQSIKGQSHGQNQPGYLSIYISMHLTNICYSPAKAKFTLTKCPQLPSYVQKAVLFCFPVFLFFFITFYLPFLNCHFHFSSDPVLLHSTLVFQASACWPVFLTPALPCWLPGCSAAA
jgi:hypothetical protein